MLFALLSRVRYNEDMKDATRKASVDTTKASVDTTKADVLDDVVVVEAEREVVVKSPPAKNVGGRPLKYTSVGAVQKAINKYFKECDENGKRYTVTGMALALDTNRDTLINYGKRDGFSDTIRRAKGKIEEQLEQELYREHGQVNGIIFALKNNSGWKDKTESEVTNTHLHLHGMAKASYQDADTDEYLLNSGDKDA